MKKNDNWLYLSIFYNQDNWQHLMSSCLLPLTNESYRQFGTSTILHLGNSKGDYIGLTCFTDKLDKIRLLEFYEREIVSFITNNLSPEPLMLNSRVKLFMNYPNNGIRYNAHKFLPSYHHRYNESLWEYLNFNSQEILKIMASHGCCYEDRLSIALYQIILLVHSPFFRPHFAKMSIGSDPGNTWDIEIENKYKENSEVIESIMEDCHQLHIADSHADESLHWLILWKNRVSTVVENIITQEAENNQGYVLMLNWFVGAIKSQLGITGWGNQLINYFLLQHLDKKYS